MFAKNTEINSNDRAKAINECKKPAENAAKQREGSEKMQ
jgi:hypothetical protein